MKSTEELLEITKEKYPIGCIYKAVPNGGEYDCDGDFHFLKRNEYGCCGDVNIAPSYSSKGLIYQDGIWAEIISSPKTLYNYEIY